MSTPNLGMPNVPAGTLEPSIPLNDALQLLDALVPGVVQEITATPPTTVSGDAGRVWIVGGSATGLWASHDDDLAISTGADLWRFVTPQEGWRFHNLDDGDDYRLDSGIWTAISGGGGTGDVVGPASSVADHVALFDGTTGKLIKDGGKTINQLRTFGIGIACSDETTALTSGTAKATFRMPYAFTLTGVRASLTTAQSTNGAGGIFTVDINEGGTTILSTKLTIDNTEKTSTTAATAVVISDASLADDAEITIDIDQVGDGTAKGLKVWLIGYPT